MSRQCAPLAHTLPKKGTTIECNYGNYSMIRTTKHKCIVERIYIPLCGYQRT